MAKKRAQQFRVINGNMDRGIPIATEMLLKRYVPEELQLVVQSASYAEEIMELAERVKPDLFIFYFNNIMFASSETTFPHSTVQLPQSVNNQQHGRFIPVLEMISHAKNTFNVPILVISGHSGEPPLTPFIENIADIYTSSPFEFEVVGSQLQCLFGWQGS